MNASLDSFPHYGPILYVKQLRIIFHYTYVHIRFRLNNNNCTEWSIRLSFTCLGWSVDGSFIHNIPSSSKITISRWFPGSAATCRQWLYWPEILTLSEKVSFGLWRSHWYSLHVKYWLCNLPASGLSGSRSHHTYFRKKLDRYTRYITQ